MPSATITGVLLATESHQHPCDDVPCSLQTYPQSPSIPHPARIRSHGVQGDGVRGPVAVQRGAGGSGVAPLLSPTAAPRPSVSHLSARIPRPRGTGLSPSISRCQAGIERRDGRRGVEGAQRRGRTGGPGYQGRDGTSIWDGCRGRGEALSSPLPSEPQRLCTSSRHVADASTPRCAF